MFHVLYKVFLCLITLIEYHNVYGLTLTLTNIRNTRQTGNITVKCKLPPHPTNGHWVVLNGFALPGDLIDQNTVIRFDCDAGYQLSSLSLFACDVPWNLYKFPTCEKKCSSKQSTPTTTIRCENKYGREVSCDEAVDGTFLSYSCIPSFETPLGYRKTAVCVEGQWNIPNPVCQPVCGKKIDKSILKLVYKGTIKDEREYPWIVAIYQKSLSDLAICGGSIVSQNVIITAAHCVTNEFGDSLPSEDFVTGIGKYYNKLHDKRDKNVQYVDIKRIVVMSGYTGASKRFLADIALLITKDLIVFNEMVQPVCYHDLPGVYIYPGRKGIVAGWGITESGDQPDELRTLEIPYKHEEICAEELPRDFALKFYTNDKICTGFLNQSKSVCPGDSGSGLFFENPEDGRYYIHGVVSSSPAVNGMCDPQQNSLYTKVATYYHSIDRVVSKEHLEPCTLPQHPENGKWIILGENKEPGDIVSTATVLHIQCNEGYKLSSSNSSMICQFAQILPSCEVSCPTPSFPEGTVYKCTNKNNIEINCSEAITGTSLEYSCPKRYTYTTNPNNTQICMYGSWGRILECIYNHTKDNSSIGENYVICTYGEWEPFRYWLTLFSHADKYNVSLCTHVIFLYRGLSDKGIEAIINSNFTETRKQLTSAIKIFKEKNKNLKFLLGLEGKGVSTSPIFYSTPDSKNKKITLIFNMLRFIQDSGFDGLTVTWQYSDANDKMEFIELLREMREVWDENGFLLTAFFKPHSSDTGYYTKEVFELLDFIILKKIEKDSGTLRDENPFPSIYQNSALYASSKENAWEKNHLNMDAAARNLVSSGCPKFKIVLSIILDMSIVIPDKDEHGNGNTGIYTRLFPFGYGQICRFKNTTVWDDERKCPISHYENEWVEHENKDSVRIKAEYVKDNGFLGINIWSMENDDVAGNCGPKQILLKEINKVLRKNVTIIDD